MFRLLRKSLQAPHPTLIAALSLCCLLSSWFKSLFPNWTLPGCLPRCRICSLSISHSLQIVVSLVTPCALVHTLVTHWQGTPVPMPDPDSPETTLQSQPASSFYLPMRGQWTFSEHINPVLHPHRIFAGPQTVHAIAHLWLFTQAVPFAWNTPQSSPTTDLYYVVQHMHPLAYSGQHLKIQYLEAFVDTYSGLN